MKKSYPVIAIVGIVALAVILMSAKNGSDVKQYEYASILVNVGTLTVSSGNKDFDEIEVKELKKHPSNYTPLFQKINEFEAKGFELLSTSFTASGPFILMRRAK